MKNALIIAIVFLLIVLPGCKNTKETHDPQAWQYTQPVNSGDGWETVHIESFDVDTSRISQLFNQLQVGKHKMRSVLLVKNGKLVIEEYFGDSDVDKQHDLRSLTKSITSILMGIALDKGFINSINDPFTNYIPHLVPHKNLDSRKSEITIRHLMTMSTGLDCNDWDSKSKGQEDQVYRQSDWLQYFLDLPMLHDPGTVSNYCTMGQVLINEVISFVSGMPIDEFADQYLFRPLGIKNVSWGHTSRNVKLQSSKRLYMTPRDLVKVGQLVLNSGKWNEQQLVTAEWINQSTSALTQLAGMDYGLFWWNIPLKVNNELFMLVAATGNGGQYIFIIPELDIVAVFTGDAYNSTEDKLPFAVMQDIFIFTFINKKAGVYSTTK